MRTEVIIRATRTQNVLGEPRRLRGVRNACQLASIRVCAPACGHAASCNRLLTHAGVKGRRIRELTSVVQKRFKFPEGSVELYAEKVRWLMICGSRVCWLSAKCNAPRSRATCFSSVYDDPVCNYLISAGAVVWVGL